MKKTAWALWVIFFCGLFFFHQRALFALGPASFFNGRDLFQGTALPLLCLSGIALAALGWGSILLPLTRESALDPGESPFLALAFGVGLWGFVLFAAALLGHYKSSFASSTLIAGAVLGFGFLRRWIRAPKAPPFGDEPLSLLETSFAALILWGLGMGFLKSLVPPFDVDSLSYHLALPKIWLGENRMRLLPWMIHAQYPSQTEALYGAALALKRDVAAQGLHWACGAAMTGLILFWKDWPLGRRARIFAAASFSTLPVVSHFIWRAHNDLVGGLFALGMLLALHRSFERESGSWSLAAGLLGGWMAGTRYQGAAFLASTVLAAAILRRSQWKRIGLFLLGAALTASPWYLRTWIWTGNPVWPNAQSLFPTPYWTPEFSRFFYAYFLRSGSPLEWVEPLTHLWKPTAAPLAAQYFLLPLLGLVLLRKFRWPRFFTFCLLAAIPYCFVVLPLRENWWRSLLPILPAACALAGWLLFEGEPRFPAPARRLEVLAFLVFIPAFFIRFDYPPTSLLGWRDRAHPEDTARQAFLRRTLPGYYEAWQAANQLPSNARIGLFQDSQGYYLDRDYVWIDPLAQSAFRYENQTPGSLLAALRREGVTHVLFGPPYAPVPGKPLPESYEQASQTLNAALSQNAETVYEGPRGVRLVALGSGAPSLQSPSK